MHWRTLILHYVDFVKPDCAVVQASVFQSRLKTEMRASVASRGRLRASWIDHPCRGAECESLELHGFGFQWPGIPYHHYPVPACGRNEA